MFKNLKKGNAVKGRYMGVDFTGTVRSVRLNEFTRNDSVEIDFAAPIMFRGGKRTGLFLTNLGEDDFIKVVDNV